MSAFEFDKKNILIEIPAYCDEQLVTTVKSAIIQADNPERIHFAICYQNNDMSDYDILSKMDNMSIIQVPLNQAKGACYARHLCQTLLKNEDYVLHIDSHMRFVKHWDTEMINQLEAYNDNKAVISVYPKGLREDQLQLQLDDHFFDNPSKGLVQYCKNFTQDMKHMKFCSRAFCKYDETPKKNIWVAGGYLFAYRNFDIEIPFDPQMPHVQDEHSVSLRAFTKGFTIYNPDNLYIYHWYHRPTRKMPKTAKTDEYSRLNRLYRNGNEDLDLKEYDIGNIKSIEEFETLSGLYFKEKKILKHCHAGLYFEKDIPKELFSVTTTTKNNFNDDNVIKNTKINLIIVGKNINDTKECINNVRNTAKYKHLINITIVLPIKFKNECDIQDEKIIFVENETKYGGYIAAVDFNNFNDDEFCLCIDSDIRFFGVFRSICWDEYYKRNLLNFGENSVISGFVKVTNDKIKVKYNMSNILVKRENTRFIYEKGKVFGENDIEIEPLLRDGFMFCKTKVLKEIKVDPDLLCSEHIAVYSARLFTHGYDIYYPPLMYANRISNITTLDNIGNKNMNQAVVGHFFDVFLPDCLIIPSDYEYGMGKKRRVKRWLELLNFNYAKNEKIIE